MLAATLAALHLNLPLSDAFSFAQGQAWWRNEALPAARYRRIVLMEDSLNTGQGMRGAVEAVRKTCPKIEITRVAIYGRSTSVTLGNADLICEPVDGQRIFEWNLWKHSYISRSLVDIDGVLCRDPTSEENDDGPKYRQFLETVEPLHLPYRPIGWICTTRLEKYRELTEQWLNRHHIGRQGLFMLDLPDKETRVQLGGRAEFKARVYQRLGDNAILFVESNPGQANEIAELTRKPVICMETRELASVA